MEQEVENVEMMNKELEETLNNSSDDMVEEPQGQKEQKPPLKMTAGAIYKRLNRICTPKQNGQYKLPAEVIEDYKDPARRQKVYLMFEKSGYDKDMVCYQNVRF